MSIGALQVPTIVEAPDPEDDSEDDSEDDPWIVAYADWLINLVLRTAPSSLRAEMPDSDDRKVRWTRFTQVGEHENRELLSHSTPRSLFRTVLARFGHHYLDGQLYGGSRERILEWRDQRFVARISGSNSPSVGYWIDIQAEPVGCLEAND